MDLRKQKRDSERIQIESIVKKKKDIEYKLEGSINPLRGHKLWEINTTNGSIVLASFIEKKNITWEDALRLIKGGFKRDVKINKGCVYISSLNKKSALDRFKKEKGSALIPESKLKLF